MVAGSNVASAGARLDRGRHRPQLVGDATGTTLYAAHDQVATLMTQLGLMPQIMNIEPCFLGRRTVGQHDVARRDVHDHRQPAALCDHAATGSRGALDHDGRWAVMKLRGRELYIIVGVVAVVIGVLWYFFLFSPEQKKVADLNTQYVAQQNTLQQTNMQIHQLELLQEDRAAGRSRPHQAPPGHAGRRRHPVVHRRADQDGPELGAGDARPSPPRRPRPACRSRCSPSSSSSTAPTSTSRTSCTGSRTTSTYRNGQFLVTGRMFSVVSLALAKSTSKDYPDLDVNVTINGYQWTPTGASTTSAGAQ